MRECLTPNGVVIYIAESTTPAPRKRVSCPASGTLANPVRGTDHEPQQNVHAQRAHYSGFIRTRTVLHDAGRGLLIRL